MVMLHCTRKLLARLPAAREREDPRSAGRLGSWYANLLVTKPVHLVLLVNEATRLPVLLLAAPFATLTRRIPVAGGRDSLRARS